MSNTEWTARESGDRGPTGQKPSIQPGELLLEHFSDLELLARRHFVLGDVPCAQGGGVADQVDGAMPGTGGEGRPSEGDSHDSSFDLRVGKHARGPGMSQGDNCGRLGEKHLLVVAMRLEGIESISASGIDLDERRDADGRWGRGHGRRAHGAGLRWLSKRAARARTVSLSSLLIPCRSRIS